MVVGDIGEFFHCLVQFLFRPESIQVDAFVFEGVEIAFHRRIVIWIPGFAHALGHMDGSTELYKGL